MKSRFHITQITYALFEFDSLLSSQHVHFITQSFVFRAENQNHSFCRYHIFHVLFIAVRTSNILLAIIILIDDIKWSQVAYHIVELFEQTNVQPWTFMTLKWRRVRFFQERTLQKSLWILTLSYLIIDFVYEEAFYVQIYVKWPWY